MRYFKSVFASFIIVFALAAISIGLYYLKQVTTWSLILVLFIGFFTINIISSIIIFIQYRNFTAKLSWLLVINMVPFLGAACFCIFGLRYSQRKNYSEYLQNHYLNHDIGNVTEIGSNSILNKISTMTKRGIYKGDFEFYHNGGFAIDAMFKSMRQAKKFIHLHFYIIKPGEIYEEFRQILIQKAKEGVEVRFIVDDFGRWGMPNHQITTLKDAGVKVAIFGEVHFPFIGSENGYRTHRKMIVIDGEIAYSGGLNIANEYASINKKYGMWMDLQGKITGSFVKSQSLLFLQDWELVTKIKLDFNKYTQKNNSGNSFATIIEDSPEDKESILESALVKMILNAKKTIHLATPYFVPSPNILSAFKIALLSGIKVHLYIPGKPDKKLVYSATKFQVYQLQKFGLIVHEMSNVLIHSKVGLFDKSYAYFGTANIDIRSLYSNFENINVITGESIKKIIKLFNYYDLSSEIVAIDKYKESFLRDKLMRFFVNLFSPIM